VTTEVLKCGLAFVLLQWELGETLAAGDAQCLLGGLVGSIARGARAVIDATRSHPIDSLLILVPALLYTLNNTLFLRAADLLEPPLLALFMQLKILTTGLFTSLILNRTLGARRWIALVCMTVSVMVVQVAHASRGAHAGRPGDEGQKRVAVGLAIVLVVCSVSGFAAVFFELVLKASPISLWVRNIHLATFSTLIASTAIVTHRRSRTAVLRCGYFAGYGPQAWTYVLTQAVGGLLIGAVVKYADNILKTLATAVTLIVVALISATFYGFDLHAVFVAGAAGVLFSVSLYADILKDVVPGYARIVGLCPGGSSSSKGASEHGRTYLPLTQTSPSATASSSFK